MLSKEQSEAVSHICGPMMVVAGPGSGKTRVLVERVKNLCTYTVPERILVITFARKAAEEMRRRFADLTDKNTAERVVFGTFHAVFLQWLKAWGTVEPHVIVMDEDEKNVFMEKKGLSDQALFAFQGDEVRNKYRQLKREEGRIDFDDILTMTGERIAFHQMWKEYDFFLVDEFQDIDARQYEILRKAVCPKGGESKANLFVVGDEDQAIYAFRGSEPGVFLGFAEDFPGCRRVDLSLNYRCPYQVVKMASELILHNRDRFDKHIVSAAGKRNIVLRLMSPSVSLSCSFDEQEEALSIARRLRLSMLWERIQGRKRKHRAILCRTEQEAVRIALALEEKGVGFRGRENWKEVPYRHEVLVRREMERVKELAAHPEDLEVLRSLFTVFPVLYRAGHPLDAVSGHPIIEEVLGQKDLTAEEIGELENLRKVLRKVKEDPRHVLRYVMLETDYLKVAMSRLERRNGGWFDLVLQIRQMVFGCKEPVRLMTMHGAKGLEFDEVILPGLVEEKCPRKEAADEKKIEEERRLMYVAMTRAEKRLHLSYYDGLGSRPSRFLYECGALDRKRY